LLTSLLTDAVDTVRGSLTSVCVYSC